MRSRLLPSEHAAFDAAVAKLTGERRAALMQHCSTADAAVELFRRELGRSTVQPLTHR